MVMGRPPGDRRRPTGANHRSDDDNTGETGGTQSLSRRQLLGGIGLAGAGAAIGGMAGASGLGPFIESAGAATPSGQAIVPFYGSHQAGIATPAQDRLVFATLTVVDGTDRTALGDLLSDWSDAAAKMTRGQLVGEDNDLDAPPLDTGEAVRIPRVQPDGHRGVRAITVR